MTTKRIINEDTRFYFTEFGTEITTGSLTAGSHYLVKARGESSALPQGSTGVIITAATAIALGEGDKVVPVVFSQQCGLQNVDFTLEREQVDTTALCDAIATSRAGRLSVSISGTMVAETSTGETTTTDRVLGNLMNMFVQQQDGSYEKSTVTADVNIALCLTEGIQGTDVKDIFLYAPVQITTSGLSGGTNSAKTGDISMVVTTGDYEAQLVKENRI